jgi:hypothetical protein
MVCAIFLIGPGVRCFEAGLRDRMLFGRPYRK